MNTLTSNERHEFDLVVENAHRQGWIRADAALVAEHVESTVQVTATYGPNVIRMTYPRDARWPFRLLRDLAWGSYKSWSARPPNPRAG
ncbi:MAG: hypothetical protein WDO68_19855 [Gammaproteobacteria bacterium]